MYGDVDETVFTAAGRCLERHIPFAVCRMPGMREVEFFARLNSSSDRPSVTERMFEIGEWLSPYSRRIRIPAGMSPKEILDRKILAAESATTEVFTVDTAISRRDYIVAVRQIIDRCRRRSGKTVYSRVITGENPALDIPNVARRLFGMFPGAFGFLYYTPRTGCWLGATPETLLDVDFSRGVVSTMAFAGTRTSAGDAPWDGKNLLENGFVADYICSKFREAGIAPEVSSLSTCDYGAIQHLRRDITAKLPSGIDYGQILDSINPTPALCGTTPDAAVRDITEFELHRRGCYGGFVAVNSPGKSFRSFVNLRSCRIETVRPHRFAVYAGGGIIAESDPEAEWEETRAKASRLLSLLEN